LVPFSNGLASTGTADDLVAAMRNPPKSSRPQIRWWWPGGTINPEVVRREAGIIADAGFGGFEIADVRDSIQVPIDPKEFGWATPRWIAGVEAALEEAAAKGIAASLTVGPHWPTGVPGVVPDDDAAAKELVHGLAHVEGGAAFSGAVPPPVQPRPSGWLAVQNEHPPVTPELIAVQAFRVLEEKAGAPPLLDAASLIDLTGYITRDVLNWRAPEGGKWLVLSFWQRGTGQIQNMFGMNKVTSMLAHPTPYVLDIYGPTAVQALTRFWETHLLKDRIKALLRRTGGAFFEDSIELSVTCPWTPTLLREFVRRAGYDLTPYLALLVSRALTFDDMIGGGGRPVLFRFADVDAARLRHDVNTVLNAMYVDYRIKGLNTWAARYGMKFRVQPTGGDINSGLAAAVAAIPEGDNGNDIHGWRRMAAGRDVAGSKLLSDEAGTFVKGQAHVATWRDLIYMLQRDMIGGANQMMLHGFSYEDAPGATWPGFSAFGRSIGNDWGPRDPNWVMAPGMTAAIGRMQHLLRQGQNTCDLAVLGAPLTSQAVLHAGYTFNYPAMELFDWPQMHVAGGRLCPEGPAYRALVLNAVEAIDVSVAEKLLGFARAGLPIVIVGGVPQRTRGWKDHQTSDAQVKAIMVRLQALPNVRRVDPQHDVPAALAALGVESALTMSAPHRLLAIHRRSASHDIYFLLNDSDVPTEQTLGIHSTGTPYQIDLWSGEVREIARSSQSGVSVHFRLMLSPNESAAIIIARAPLRGALPTLTPAPPRQSITLTGWQVGLDDWRPGPTPNATDHDFAQLHMNALVPWSELPNRKGMAGTAHYTTKLTLDQAPMRARLSLGAVGGTAAIIVNRGPTQIVNPFTLEIEISRWLMPGSNSIEILVASPLNNRLIAEHIENIGFKPPEGAPGAGGGPPPPPTAKAPADRDLVDGPPGMTGMQPGAAPPGGPRHVQQNGLLGPVTLICH
ncbi:MAG: hypothetical protein KGJ05_04195, partial [Alphaproteobacteria bacterium]|nr:hypothetical protein [Alphaproteobacteria bacterium]